MEILESHSFDIVITDIFMPGQDGIVTLRQIRKRFPTVKVIVISGGDSTGMMDLRQDAELLGVAPVLDRGDGREVDLAGQETVVQLGGHAGHLARARTRSRAPCQAVSSLTSSSSTLRWASIPSTRCLISLTATSSGISLDSTTIRGATPAASNATSAA